MIQDASADPQDEPNEVEVGAGVEVSGDQVAPDVVTGASILR